ncbi:MAG: hypothetical protein H6815_03545 [Phycisphaeraceae bacterium]|nr:hypothetical protein [Phycisphaerales bacterium]MCB9859502.1 hypothetical protein [Phycisphaeraceae bacterium]
MKKTVCACIVACAVGSAASADVVYAGPGAGLVNAPGVVFPNGVPAVNGTALNLITPPQTNFVTVVIPLCNHISGGTGSGTGTGTGTGSGTGSTGSGSGSTGSGSGSGNTGAGSGADNCNIVGLSVSASFSGFTSGFDVNMGVTDGTRFVGSNHSDYFRFYPAEGQFNGNALVNMNYGVNVPFANGPVGNTFTFSQEYTFSTNSTDVASTSEGGTFNLSLEGLDLTQDLALVIGLFDTNEAGVLNSINIVTQTVPAPGPIALLGVGGIIAARRQRRGA